MFKPPHHRRGNGEGEPFPSLRLNFNKGGSMQQFEVLQQLAEIRINSRLAKRITVTSWNGQPGKLDLRIWRTDQEPAKPGKGVTISDQDAQTIADALQAYLKGKQDSGI